MNAIIDNPKRIVTIGRSADYVRDRLKVIDKWAGSHAGIIISQPNYTMNSYTFTCDGFGARPGGQGRVVVTPVDEGSCTVMVEIGRPSGRVDDRAEAKLRSEQIDAFLKILSYLLINNNIIMSPTDEQIQDMCRATGGSGVTAALVALGVIGLLIIVLI